MTQQKIIVNGILECDGEILLAKRAKTKRIAPGKWHLPGGHVEFGEAPEQTLVREFKEEFNLDISVGSIVRAFSYVDDDAHTIGLSYRVTCDNVPDVIETDPSDNERVEWISAPALGDYLSHSDHDYVTLSQIS